MQGRWRSSFVELGRVFYRVALEWSRVGFISAKLSNKNRENSTSNPEQRSSPVKAKAPTARWPYLLHRHDSDGESLQLSTGQHSHITVQHVRQVHLKLQRITPHRTDSSKVSANPTQSIISRRQSTGYKGGFPNEVGPYIDSGGAGRVFLLRS